MLRYDDDDGNRERITYPEGLVVGRMLLGRPGR